ncbi:MAG TPA: hypothetical protein VHG11_04345, partial [Pseudorhizobium sp.]|nr:hypothetical protein [Pseudorhizobium sp.]
MASAILYGWSSSAALSAQGSDPDWPCIQRKVPELSIGQIWTGPELPETSGADSEISALIGELAARRVPLAEAEQKIQNFTQDLTREERQDQLSKLMRSLFDHMNRERSQVIAGIGRYAQKQRDLAAALRHEASAIDALRANSQNPSEVTIRNDQLMLRTRI